MNNDTTDQQQSKQESQEGMGYAEKQREKFQDEDRELTDVPEVTDAHREKAKEMRESYTENRPTTIMPGTAGTVTGTAVNDWVDDEGNPKYGEVSAEGEQGLGDESSEEVLGWRDDTQTPEHHGEDVTKPEQDPSQSPA